MATVKRIDRRSGDPLRRLEESLGATKEQLLEEMGFLAESQEDWESHLPYSVAARYFNDVGLQEQYSPHVDSCAYCQQLLDAVNPPIEQIEQFSREAAAGEAGGNRNSGGASTSKWRYIPLAASVVLAVCSVAFFGFAQKSDEKTRLSLVNELRQNPGELSRLETSADPNERFRAAQWYFELQQPRLAYSQVADGLAMAGVSATDVEGVAKTAEASTASSSKSVQDAVSRLAAIKQQGLSKNAAEYLEMAQLQAQLGMHRPALQSIQAYLKARDTDPKVIAEYSRAVMAAYEPSSGFN
jgi:hypothetical protein